MIEWAQIKDRKTIRQIVKFRKSHEKKPFPLKIWKRIYNELGYPKTPRPWTVVGKMEDDGSKPGIYVLKGMTSPRAAALLPVEDLMGLPMPIKETLLSMRSQAFELSDKSSLSVKATDADDPRVSMLGFKTGFKYEDIKKKNIINVERDDQDLYQECYYPGCKENSESLITFLGDEKQSCVPLCGEHVRDFGKIKR